MRTPVWAVVVAVAVWVVVLPLASHPPPALPPGAPVLRLPLAPRS